MSELNIQYRYHKTLLYSIVVTYIAIFQDIHINFTHLAILHVIDIFVSIYFKSIKEEKHIMTSSAYIFKYFFEQVFTCYLFSTDAISVFIIKHNCKNLYIVHCIKFIKYHTFCFPSGSFCSVL